MLDNFSFTVLLKEQSANSGYELKAEVLCQYDVKLKHRYDANHFYYGLYCPVDWHYVKQIKGEVFETVKGAEF